MYGITETRRRAGVAVDNRTANLHGRPPPRYSLALGAVELARCTDVSENTFYLTKHTLQAKETVDAPSAGVLRLHSALCRSLAWNNGEPQAFTAIEDLGAGVSSPPMSW